MTSPLDPSWTPTADLREEIKRLKVEVERLRKGNALLLGDNQEVMRINKDLYGESERLRGAILWALGELPDEDGEWFGDGKSTTDATPFWWRTKLRALADPGKG